MTTLEPGSRNVEPARGTGPARVTELSAVEDGNHGSGGGGEGGDGGEGSGGRADGGGADARCLEVLAPDPGSMDLAEAPVIIAGGAGLGGPDAFAALGRVAAGLGASVGATRVVTDAGWLGHERQIGTTGVVVDPRVYVALGISGAVQHTGGIGHPEHIVAVNLDPSCPMMAMADLAIVTDARALLAELAGWLGVSATVARRRP